MVEWINKYHLKTGLILSIMFPGIFIFSDPDTSTIFIRFISSVAFIFILWVINFTLLDFNTRKMIYARLGLSFILAISLYLFIGLVIDQSRLLLSQIKGELITSVRAWFFLLLRICLFNSLFILIKYLFDSSKEKQRITMENELLKRENILAMHEALKQQVNPHFLFNSLHTLKSLVKQNQNQSLIFIDELASVYRYMLLHHEKNEVPIEEEINFLKSYLHLLKLRFGESIITQIQIPESLFSFRMPPNTLQLLIENAVKHNILSHKRPLCISIFVTGNYLAVENNLQPKRNKNISSQLGLSNINNRYKILNGKGILVEKNENKFKVLLPIA